MCAEMNNRTLNVWGLLVWGLLLYQGPVPPKAGSDQFLGFGKILAPSPPLSSKSVRLLLLLLQVKVAFCAL